MYYSDISYSHIIRDTVVFTKTSLSMKSNAFSNMLKVTSNIFLWEKRKYLKLIIAQLYKSFDSRILKLSESNYMLSHVEFTFATRGVVMSEAN